MVTRPTGKPAGRPKKPRPPIKPKRPRGRPPKPLAADPDRYEIAYFQVAADRGYRAGISERRIAETLAALRHGALVPTPENLSAMSAGKPYAVRAPAWRGREGGFDWRNKNSFRPIADALRLKAHRMRKDPAADQDARWLDHMSWAWLICLERYVDLEGLAEYLADAVGEREYFDAWMRPMLRGR